jgi:hypothetical protein
MMAGDLSEDTRAQTLQDFATGISVFLVAALFVFSTIPTAFVPFEAPVETEDSVRAERYADQTVADVTLDEEMNVMNESRRATLVSLSTSQLYDRYDVAPGDRLNVTVHRFNAGGNPVVEEVGDPYREQAVGAVVRILTGPNCRPTCRIVVRAW